MNKRASDVRTIAVITGSRAEFGLLVPVIAALRANPSFDVKVIACGSHLLPPANTIREVRATVGVDCEVAMQQPGQTGRVADAMAVGWGVAGFADAFGRIQPQWVVVLGDRIEAFAAASAASIGGFALVHLHGGDRAEGVADEVMRHAITKLAHLHLPATPVSAERIVRMGEPADRVVVVGSPAIDGLDAIPAMIDDRAATLGDPAAVLLMHPSGLGGDEERKLTKRVIECAAAAMNGKPILALSPNFDADREAALEELQGAAQRFGWRLMHHLPRSEFIALLKRLAQRSDGVLIGNSSAGLIECAALRLPVVDIGPRQNGRERPNNVVHVDGTDADEIRQGILRAWAMDRSSLTHPYGSGQAGARCAAVISEIDPRAPGFLRKLCSY